MIQNPIDALIVAVLFLPFFVIAGELLDMWHEIKDQEKDELRRWLK